MKKVFGTLVVFKLVFLLVDVDGCFLSEEEIKPRWSKLRDHLMLYPLGPETGKQPMWGPFRIKIEYIKNELSFQNRIEQSDWDKVEKIVEWVIKEFKTIAPEVRQLKIPILIPRPCISPSVVQNFTNCSSSNYESCSPKGRCYKLFVDEKYSDACYDDNNIAYAQGAGVADTDLVLFITIDNCQYRARGVSCQLEPNFNRPVAGVIVFCLKSLTENPVLGEWRSMILHELLHIVLYPLNGANYVDDKGNQRKKTFVKWNQTWKSRKGNFTIETISNSLPSVQRFARQHFKCHTLEGVELLNETKLGKTTKDNWGHYFIHFDERLFPDALMTSVYSPGDLITELEMVFLKDTGWYKINQSYKAAQLKETRGKGCNFARMSCYEYMQSVKYDPKLIYPYCSFQNATTVTCSPLDHHQAIACRGVHIGDNNYSNIPYDMYDYEFTSSDKRNKFCPMFSGREPGETSIFGFKYNAPLCYFNDHFYGCKNKVCISSVIRINGSFASEGICYSFQCSKDKIQFSNEDLSFECNKYESGKVKRINDGASVQCPEYKIVCDLENPKNCTPADPVRATTQTVRATTQTVRATTQTARATTQAVRATTQTVRATTQTWSASHFSTSSGRKIAGILSFTQFILLFCLLQKIVM